MSSGYEVIVDQDPAAELRRRARAAQMRYARAMERLPQLVETLGEGSLLANTWPGDPSHRSPSQPHLFILDGKRRIFRLRVSPHHSEFIVFQVINDLRQILVLKVPEWPPAPWRP